MSAGGSGRLCVLGSGSKGNSAVVCAGGEVVLVDLGLSPRLTEARLAQVGLSLGAVTGALLTHLDMDHCHPGWCQGSGALPRGAEVCVAGAHGDRAGRRGLNGGRVRHFEGEFVTRGGLTVLPLMQLHDELGVAAFRVGLPGRGWLGFATDIGRVTDELIAHLHGVDVLAIESNYCPVMQAASDRPGFLKRRIMGGWGHLSNQDAARATAAIEPREHAVFLHLSRDCNDPDLVWRMHEGADYAVTISSADEPTRWVPVRPAAAPAGTLMGAAGGVGAQRAARGVLW
ncbi:MAG: hypothetical protein C0475_01930 [Planctomyces sp.]|nr:hypothetical protein [Planctomyces sp.]MBA4039259.1 hypothetical protein [Planctomyces sp.]MBA4119592.1 hypothetical protein [Isosphaera sp.]